MTASCTTPSTAERREPATVAASLGVDCSVVDRAIRDGSLSSLRVGGRILIDRDSVQSWLRRSAVPSPWWDSARNPACRSWCTENHTDDEFARGGLMYCETSVPCDSPVVECVTVSAGVRADETPGAAVGSLIFDEPEIEIYMHHDGRDGEVCTPEGLEQLMEHLPAALARAREIADTAGVSRRQVQNDLRGNNDLRSSAQSADEPDDVVDEDGAR